MGGLQAFEQFHDNARGDPHGHGVRGRLALDPFAQGHALDHFHGDVDLAVGAPDIIDGHHIIVSDILCGGALLDQALDGRFTAHKFRGDQFQRARLACDLVIGPVDRAHAAAPDQTLDLVAVSEDGAFLEHAFGAAARFVAGIVGSDRAHGADGFQLPEPFGLGRAGLGRAAFGAEGGLVGDHGFAGTAGLHGTILRIWRAAPRW